MAFKTRYSYFEYQVIFYGLFNFLASFQDYINKTLIKKIDIFIIVYSNNILIYINKKDLIDSIW